MTTLTHNSVSRCGYSCRHSRVQAARAALARHAHGFPWARDLLYETLVVVVHDAAPAARGAVAVVHVVLLNRFPCNGT